MPEAHDGRAEVALASSREGGQRESPRLATPAEPPAPAPGDVACANCGAPLAGPYCAQCGQRAGDRLVSVRQIVADALEDQLSLTAALPRTLVALLVHPGLVTAEYLKGRIARYIPPMRLYLACSLAFFLALSFLAKPPRFAPEGRARATGADSTEVVRVGGGHLSLDTRGMPPWLERRVEAQFRRLGTMGGEAASRAVLSAFLDAAPKVVFVLMPVFALLLKLLYARRRRLYVEHFVFALHLHAVAFAAFTVMVLVRNGWVNSAIALWLAAYLWLAMRRVYGQNWFWTSGKFLLIGYLYFMMVASGVAIGTVLAVLSV